MAVKEFTIPGDPIGKPRMTRRDKWAQRPCVLRYREWCDLARLCAGKVPDATDILSVSWEAVFAMPKSWPEKKKAALDGQRHRSTPDRDNVDKALLDCLWRQDSGISDAGYIRKRWGRQGGLHVRIEYDDRATTV